MVEVSCSASAPCCDPGSMRSAQEATVESQPFGNRSPLRDAGPIGSVRVPAVRYAADDDCPADCGHPEPAVLARRHWSGKMVGNIVLGSPR